MKKAETLAQIKDVTTLDPLEGAELTTFYVATDNARALDLPPITYLHQYIVDEAPKTFRLLFASHPGAGKSTELNRLIRDTSDRFWFVQFSARKELDMTTMTYLDLILVIMEKLFERGCQDNLIKNQRIMEPVRKWLSEIVIESKIQTATEGDIEVGVGLDGLLGQILGLAAKIKSSLTLTRESAETVRQVIKPRIAELRNHCNLVLTEINNHLDKGKKLVIVVDDVDKLDVEQARKLFVENTGILAELNASIIYTVPLFLVHSPDRARLRNYFEILVLPMIKTYSQDGNRFEAGWDILREVVARRIDKKLIEPAALDLAIAKTGGILRDLLRVIQTASMIVRLSQKGEVIDKERMGNSLNRLRTEYRQMITGRNNITTDQLYQKLVEIDQSPTKKVAIDPILQQLLYMQVVIEYNGNGWYNVHPLIREELVEMGKVHGLAR